MSWPTFILTSLVIGMAVTSLVLLIVAPDKMPIDQWLQMTWLGSPLHMFALTFLLGGWLGFMEPTHPLAKATPETDGLARATGIYCTSVIVVSVLWDIGVVYLGGVNASISRWMQNTAYDAPLACGGCGFLCGHFFLYRNWVFR